MKNTTFEKVKAHILDHVELKDLENYIKKGYRPLELVKDGFFCCYYSQAFEELQNFFGKDFDETRYLNKDESRKYKNGVPYVWTIYEHTVAMAIEKIAKTF